MLVTLFRTTTTTVLGVASGNTIRINGQTNLIYVAPTTATTRYTFTLTDKDDDVILSEGVVGTLRFRDPILLNGVYTWDITGADNDEAFTIKILTKEGTY